MPNDKFVNPYTFIGLGRTKSGSSGSGNLTGVLRCSLNTLTPLIIPSTANEDAFPSIADGLVNAWIEEKWRDLPPTPKNIAEKEKERTEMRAKTRSYDFFSYDNPKGDREKIITSPPVIPGSSIRGMIRSVYEALTDSCLSTIDEEMVLNKRSVIPYDRNRNSGNMGVGVIEKAGGKWLLKAGRKALLPVKDVDGYRPVFNRGFTLFSRSQLPGWGGKFFISLGGRYGKNQHLEYPVVSGVAGEITNQHNIAAYHLPGYKFGDGNRKHFDTVVYDFERLPPYELTQEDINRIEKIESLYNTANAKDKNKPPYEGWANFKSGKPFPVYFENLGGEYYISPACISQEVFTRKVGDMIGDFAPCTDSENLCEACRLFGMVGKKSNDTGSGSNNGNGEDNQRDRKKVNAIASRVMFRDATAPEPDNWYDGEPRLLPILGQPRPSATEFYMKKPDVDAATFNYDYFVTHGTRSADRNKKTKLDSAEIKGRKFYWHNSDESARYANAKGKDASRPDMSIIARAVSQRRSFTFDVAFENVTEKELAKLIWVLSIGGKASSQDGKPSHAHKLGHGKPIGFGSVGISVNFNESRVYVLDENLSISASVFVQGGDSDIACNGVTLPDVSGSLKHVSEFLHVSNWSNRYRNVMYPLSGPADDKTVYAWFGANRRGLGNDFNQKFIHTLPDLNERDQELPLNPMPLEGRRTTDNTPQEWTSSGRDFRRRGGGVVVPTVSKDVAAESQPSALPAPSDKRIKDAINHLGREHGRPKGQDEKHLNILRDVPQGHEKYAKAQSLIKKHGGVRA